MDKWAEESNEVVCVCINVTVGTSKSEMSHDQKWLLEEKNRGGLNECALAWISAAAQSSTESKPTHPFSL